MNIDKLAEKIAICAYCPFMCKDVCSVYSQTKVDSLSPSMHEYLLWLILEGKKSFSKEVAEILYKACCSCLLCQSWCATNQDVPEKVRAARADIVDLNLIPKPILEVNRSTLISHNPFKESHEKRFMNIEREIESKSERGELVYYLGCSIAYRQPEIAEATISILKQADLTFDLLNGGEWCCGLPQYELGLLETAKKLAQHNHQILKDNGYKAVITSCPECYYMFKEVYPKLGFLLDVKIYHTSEYIKHLLENRRLKVKRKLLERLTYHDPCYLGRHLKIFDEPRAIIKWVSKNFVEMRWNRDKAYCGGGGIAYSIIHPDIAGKFGDKVSEEAEKVGAEILVTSCPTCKNQLQDNLRKKKIKVYDISEILQMLL